METLQGTVRSEDNIQKQGLKQVIPLKKISSARQFQSAKGAISLKPNLLITNQTKKKIFPEDFFSHGSAEIESPKLQNFKSEKEITNKKLPVKIIEDPSDENKINFFKKKPMSALSGSGKKALLNNVLSTNKLSPVCLKNLKENSQIQSIPEVDEDKNKTGHSFLNNSLKQSINNFKETKKSLDKFNSFNYTIKNTKFACEEESPLKVEIPDYLNDKSQESNIDASTSGSYIAIGNKKKSNIFNFENVLNLQNLQNVQNSQNGIDNDFILNHLHTNELKQTACFSPNFKITNNLNPENLNSIRKNLNTPAIEIKPYNNAKQTNNIKDTIRRPSPRLKSSEKKSGQPSLSPTPNNNLNNRRHTLKQNVILESERFFSPRVESSSKIFQNLNGNSKAKKSDNSSLPVILPPLSTRRKANESIQTELKNIFNVAQNYKEDPEVKTKLDNLIQNIADIKNVLQLKNKNRINVVSAPLRSKINNSNKEPGHKKN